MDKKFLVIFNAMESISLIQSKEFDQTRFLSRDCLDIIT